MLAPVKIARTVIINIIVLLVILVGLEFGARLFHVIFQEGTFFRDHRFISPWITSYDYPPPWVMENGAAFFRHRETPTPREKPPNTTRIIAVGGSTTVNDHIVASHGIHYPLMLEKHLNEAGDGRRYEVLNAGGDAYSTAHSLINIQFRLVEFNPDIILLMHNLNDSTINSFKAGATADYGNKYLRPYYLNPQLQGSLSLTGFLTQSRVLAKTGLLEYVAKIGDLRPENDIEYGLQLFKRNLTHIIRICEAHGIRVVLLSQPTNMTTHHWMKEGTFVTYNQAVAEIAEKEGVDFIDMFSEFGHDKQFFLDTIHYTADGIRRFARILYPRVLEIASQSVEGR